MAAAAAPSEQLISQLVDMGFSRDRATEALRVSQNDIGAAATHLLASGSINQPQDPPPSLRTHLLASGSIKQNQNSSASFRSHLLASGPISQPQDPSTRQLRLGGAYQYQIWTIGYCLAIYRWNVPDGSTQSHHLTYVWESDRTSSLNIVQKHQIQFNTSCNILLRK